MPIPHLHLRDSLRCTSIEKPAKKDEVLIHYLVFDEISIFHQQFYRIFDVVDSVRIHDDILWMLFTILLDPCESNHISDPTDFESPKFYDIAKRKFTRSQT